jgi:hypothetical protein
MRALTAALAVLLAFGAGPAAAAIRITASSYENGITTVEGQAAPNRVVTMDGRFSAKADAGGHFEFTETYKPATCMAYLTSGEDSYSALINGCLLDEARDRGVDDMAVAPARSR